MNERARTTRPGFNVNGLNVKVNKQQRGLDQLQRATVQAL
jgi:hypothetical protein